MRAKKTKKAKASRHVELFPWFHDLKHTEGGMGGTFFKDLLKRAGIPCRVEPSYYVGHFMISVPKGKATAIRAALKDYLPRGDWRLKALSSLGKE
jgi:hypothetical protein